MAAPIVRTEADVSLFDAGGRNERRISVANVACSWVVNRAGTLSTFVPTSEMRRFGIADARGLWLLFRHPTAGDWGGRVTRQNWGRAEVEIAAESFHTLLRKRRVSITWRASAAPPGAQYLRLLRHLDLDEPTWLIAGETDEDGAPVPGEFRLADAYGGVIPKLIADGEHEWDVGADRVSRFARRVGTDLSGTVMLSEGRHVAEASVPRDLWTIENDTVGVGGETRVKVRKSKRKRPHTFAEQLEDRDSILAYGRLQGARVYGDARTKSEILRRLRADLDRTKDPVEVVEATVLDVDRAWSWFRHGDSVRFVLPSENAEVVARVMARSLDMTAGTLKLSAKVERWLS